MEWEKLEVIESDFYTNFLINSINFLMNSVNFSEIRPGRFRRILTIFEKTDGIFKPCIQFVLTGLSPLINVRLPSIATPTHVRRLAGRTLLYEPSKKN
jgi:hypothetical protein